MKVVLDAVYNHTGREFFAFQDILERAKSQNILTGILSTSCRLGVNGEKFQTSNASAITVECQSLI